MDVLKTWIREQIPALTKDIMALVALRSVSEAPQGEFPYGEGCSRVLAHAMAMAQTYGFSVENHENHCASVLYPGNGDTTEELAIAVHLDTVPEGTGWTHNPFMPFVKDGWIYGRGAADNKGAAVASLYVLRYLQAQGIRLRHDLRLIFGCDEENQMRDIRHFLKTHKAPRFVLVPDAGLPAVYAEKRGLNAVFSTTLSGNLLSFTAGLSADTLPAEAQAVIGGVEAQDARAKLGAEVLVSAHPNGVAVSAKGISAHSAFPERGDSAAVRLAKALLGSGLMDEPSARTLTLIGAFEAYDGSILGIDCKDEVSGALSVSGCHLWMKEKTLYHSVNCRIPVTVAHEAVWQPLERYTQAHGFADEGHEFKPGNYINPDHPMVRLLTQHAHLVTGLEMTPYTMNGGTYAKMFPCAVSAGFGLRDQKKPCPKGHGGGHQPDECVSVTNLQNGIEIYVKTLMDLDRL